MNTALWIVQGLLALLFSGAGGSKMAMSKDELLEMEQMAWAEDFSANAIKGIGAVEVLGALGLILPRATGIAVILTPLAAVGLMLTMLGAAATHARREEYPMIGGNLVLFFLAAFVAYGRFSE